MRAMRAGLLVLATLSAGVAPFASGCKDEKSGVEKRAEELAASASAEKSAKLAAASQVDPAELKYMERKKSLEQTVRDFKADEGRIMSGDPAAVAGTLRKYFDGGPEGDKLAKELEAKRKKDYADGYRLKKILDPETRVDGSMEKAEVEITEETAAKNTTACLHALQVWKWTSEKWVFVEQKSVSKVDCAQ